MAGGTDELLALVLAAERLVTGATREPEDEPAGTSLVGTADLDRLALALDELRDEQFPGFARVT